MSYPIASYLHVGDSVYWQDVDTGQRQGPATITGFSEMGYDENGHPDEVVNIAPLNGVSAINVLLITQRTTAAGDVMRFHAGTPV